MSLGTWLQKKGEEHRARQPAKRQRQIEKAEHRLQLQQVRQKTAESRATVAQTRTAVGMGRVKLTQARQKSMPQGGMFGPSIFAGPPTMPSAPMPPASRPSKKGKKRQATANIGGQQYQLTPMKKRKKR